MELKTKYPILAMPLVLLLLVATTTSAYAWDWSYNNCSWGNCGYYHHSWDNDCCYHHYWSGCNSCDNGGIGVWISSFQGLAYQAGISDAIYDHDNGNSYNPIGQCQECHSQVCWDNFKHGYDHQWNTYQNQETTSININGNNYYVSTDQNNNQQQNTLQQLAHTLCGLVNCNGPTGLGYVNSGPVGPQGIGYIVNGQ